MNLLDGMKIAVNFKETPMKRYFTYRLTREGVDVREAHRGKEVAFEHLERIEIFKGAHCIAAKLEQLRKEYKEMQEEVTRYESLRDLMYDNKDVTSEQFSRWTANAKENKRK